MSESDEDAASVAEAIVPERTVDFFLIATARVRGNDLAAVRRTLRHELESVDIADAAARIADDIELTTIGFAGGVQAFVPQESEDADLTEERHYEGSGMNVLAEWMSNRIPLMFRPVQLSPSGQDMRPVTTDELCEVMAFDRVIRVGLAEHICIENGVTAPEVVIDADGHVHVYVQPGSRENWQPVTGRIWAEWHTDPILLESASITTQLAELILSRPGLYVQVRTGRPDDSHLVMYCDDSEQIWAAHG